MTEWPIWTEEDPVMVHGGTGERYAVLHVHDCFLFCRRWYELESHSDGGFFSEVFIYQTGARRGIVNIPGEPFFRLWVDDGTSLDKGADYGSTLEKALDQLSADYDDTLVRALDQLSALKEAYRDATGKEWLNLSVGLSAESDFPIDREGERVSNTGTDTESASLQDGDAGVQGL